MLAASSVGSLSQPKSDTSDFGQLRVPNSGKPEFGWERVGVRGASTCSGSRRAPPSPGSPLGRLATLSRKGRG